MRHSWSHAGYQLTAVVEDRTASVFLTDRPTEPLLEARMGVAGVKVTKWNPLHDAMDAQRGAIVRYASRQLRAQWVSPEVRDSENQLLMPWGSGSRGAILSEDRVHRYRLWRMWDPDKPAIAWMMLNPSTADALVDDPTIRSCLRLSKAWGFGRLDVVNVFAFRATDPKALLEASKRGIDVVGEDNLEHIQTTCVAAEEVVCGWGSYVGRPSMKDVLSYLRSWREQGLLRTSAIATNKDDSPRHPLYSASNASRRPYIPMGDQ